MSNFLHLLAATLKQFLPSVVLSTALHSVLLATLACVVFAPPPQSFDVSLVAQVEDPANLVEVKPPKLSVDFMSAPLVGGGASFLEPADVAAASARLSPPALWPLEVRSLDLPSGEAMMSQIGDGKPADQEASATFFGVRSRARRVMYLVDNSNSMIDGRFETACGELAHSVEALRESQAFYVIFYSDTSYPLFHPEPAADWVTATSAAKRRLRDWLVTIERCSWTRAEAAFDRAFAMQPDVIYLLGDGQFTDGSVPRLLRRQEKAVVHALGIRMQRGPRAAFQRLANHFGGTFHDVDVERDIVAHAGETSRPRNTTTNGVWGLTLQEQP